MPNISKTLTVKAPQAEVWTFVKDMGNWASRMPGYVSHEIVDEDKSVWTVQFNVGPFTRPCVMDVHVTQWGEPSAVNFTVKGRFDPFQGQGAFTSRPAEAGTQIDLEFGVEGTGSMAKVISAMAAPVLVTVGDQFVKNMATAIAEQGSGQAGTAAAASTSTTEPGVWRRFTSWLRGLFGRAKPESHPRS